MLCGRAVRGETSSDLQHQRSLSAHHVPTVPYSGTQSHDNHMTKHHNHMNNSLSASWEGDSIPSRHPSYPPHEPQGKEGRLPQWNPHFEAPTPLELRGERVKVVRVLPHTQYYCSVTTNVEGSKLAVIEVRICLCVCVAPRGVLTEVSIQISGVGGE